MVVNARATRCHSTVNGRAPAPRAVQVALFTACVAGASGAHAQNALVGQQLWDAGRSAPPPALISCATCHGGSAASANGLTLAVLRQRLTANGGLTLANAQASITRSLATPGGVPSMIALYPGSTLSSTDIANLAAYVANVTSPAPAPTPTPTPTPAPPPPPAPLQASPSALSFSAAVGSTSGQQIITVRNTGSAAVTLAAPAVVALSTSAAPADFLLANPGATGTTCVAGASLAAGAQCTLGIQFRPSATGARSAEWQVRFSTAGVAPVSIALSGSASAASPAPAPAPAPAPSPAPAPAPTPAPAPAPGPTPSAPGGAAGTTNAGAGALHWPALGLLAAAWWRRRSNRPLRTN